MMNTQRRNQGKKNISFVLELHENEKKQPQQSLWGAEKKFFGGSRKLRAHTLENKNEHRWWLKNGSQKFEQK